MTIKICKKCSKKMHIATADFGGSFDCARCNAHIISVASIGHGKICNNCQRDGYCKYCGKLIPVVSGKIKSCSYACGKAFHKARHEKAQEKLIERRITKTEN